jgi:hypothetical protein
MSELKHGNIITQKILSNVWIAKTKTLEPLKAEIEMKGNSELNAYEKLMNWIESKESPERIQTLENGNKIYHFKK